MSDQCVHILVKGRVQGVCFRAYTEKEAKELGITGWVRNLKDGRVEILARGREVLLTQLQKWCHEGSPFARVDLVKTRTIEEEENFPHFTILPTAPSPIAEIVD